LAQVTSFGPSGLVILHKLDYLGLLPKIRVLTINTLHLFPETYKLIDNKVLQYPKMNLKVIRPECCTEKEEFDRKHGEDLWKSDPEQYSFLSKVEPMLRGLEENNVKAWITDRRRSQGGQRDDLQFLEKVSAGEGYLKINPLLT